MQTNNEDRRNEPGTDVEPDRVPTAEAAAHDAIADRAEDAADEGKGGTAGAVRRVPGIDILINPVTGNGVHFHDVGVDAGDPLEFDLFVAPGFDGKLFELYRRQPTQRQHLVVMAGRLDGTLLKWDPEPDGEPVSREVSLGEGAELTVPEGWILTARNRSDEEPATLEVSLAPAHDAEAFLRRGYALGLRLYRDGKAGE
jgi:hypothetical protein